MFVNSSYPLNDICSLQPNWGSLVSLANKVPVAASLLPKISFSEVGGEEKSALGTRLIVPTRISEEETFKSANVGGIALFANQNRFVHLAIALGQYFLKLPEIGINITHAGIVSEKSSDKVISLYEIPGPGSRISKMDYALEHLKLNAQLLFFDPYLLLPHEERDSFINHLLKISKTFIDHVGQATEHKFHYNLPGIARLPLESATFLKSDWITLLDDLIEYHLLTEGCEGIYMLKYAKYFCSEFVLKAMHLARLMQKHPEICEQIKSAIKAHRLTDSVHSIQRELFVEHLYQEFMESGQIEQLMKDPLFFMPSRSVTPAHLMQFAETHHLPLYRVANPNAKPESELEVFVSRWLYQSSIAVKDVLKRTYQTALARLRDSLSG